MRHRIVELERSERDYKAIIDLIRRSSGNISNEIVRSIRNTEDTTESHLVFDHLVREILLREDPQLSQPLQNETGGAQSDSASLSLSPQAAGSMCSSMSHNGTTSHLPWSPCEHHLPISSVPSISDWTAVTSDTEFAKDLLDVYFTWSHPFHLLFSEETFCHGIRTGKLRYCTPLLVNAVLAIGCAYSDRLEARKVEADPATVGDHFFDEAKRLLDEEQGISLTTIQALGLMSVRATMRDESHNSRLYISHMMAGIKKLQLASPPSQTSSKISEAEIQTRKITFWGCFVLETSSALSNRRMPALSSSEIEIIKPLVLPELENTLWKPYGTRYYDGGQSEMAQASNKYSILCQSSLLAEIVNDFAKLLFRSDVRVEDEQLVVRYEEMKRWIHGLPAELNIQNQRLPLPQVITLHCYYHYCIIQLFRRPLMLSFLQHSTAPPQACLDAAICISQLINTYREIYGLDKCFSTLPRCLTFAAIVHVLSLDTSLITISKDIRSTELHLAQAIRALYEMKADRCLNIVRDLIEKWGVTVPAPVRIMLNEIQLESTIGGLNNGHDYTNGIMDETDGPTNNADDENENESNDDAASMTNSLDMVFDESWMNF
ncbi:Fungal specific transcription factor domain containing protein [Hyaloscypha variabilis]